MEFRKLKAKMVESGINQDKLSAMLGMSRSTLNAKLNGYREFTLSEALNICMILNISDFETFFCPSNPKNARK